MWRGALEAQSPSKTRAAILADLMHLVVVCQKVDRRVKTLGPSGGLRYGALARGPKPPRSSSTLLAPSETWAPGIPRRES